MRILGSLYVLVCRVLTLNIASNNLGEEGAKLVAQALPRYAMLIADDVPACIDLTAFLVLFYTSTYLYCRANIHTRKLATPTHHTHLICPTRPPH
jgi:hypothetical protein